jgi:hypothetical protein
VSVQISDRHVAPGRKKHSPVRALLKPLYKSCMQAIPTTRMGDRLFACLRFLRFHGRLPSNARTYSDVLYKIKTTDDILDPLRVFVSDKEFVKWYVRAIVGDRYNVPTIDVITSPQQVDTYRFPASCCIKPTHVSGHVVFRRDGEAIDRERIKGWFGVDYYKVNREANYRFLRPKIIVEPLIFGSSNVEDYKIFCVNGIPKLIQVDVDRHTAHKRKYFDASWRELDFSIKYPRTDAPLTAPQNLDEMLNVAAQLGRHFWFVRVDLYSNGSQLFVGELTHCADSADGVFTSAAAERMISDYLFHDAPLPGSQPSPQPPREGDHRVLAAR